MTTAPTAATANATDPFLQYGALGLVAFVVLVGLAIAWHLSRALVLTLGSVATSVLTVREAVHASTVSLIGMRDMLGAQMHEARVAMGRLRESMAHCRCTFRPDAPDPAKRPQ